MIIVPPKDYSTKGKGAPKAPWDGSTDLHLFFNREDGKLVPQSGNKNDNEEFLTKEDVPALEAFISFLKSK